MALSRQNLPVLDPEKYKVAEGVRKGAYVLQDGGPSPDVLLVAAGPRSGRFCRLPRI